jgi:KDO2-lipid IV(A) lauroyltransferase
MLDYLVYLFVRMLICVVQSLPVETSHRLARGLAGLFGGVLNVRGHVVNENLRHAFPEKTPRERRAIAVGMWEHLFLLAIEAAQLPRKIHETNWRDYIVLHGLQPMANVLIARRPIIVVTGHFGNFEAGGYVLGLLGYPTYSVARPLDNPYLDAFVKQFRESTGQYLVPKNDGYDTILEVLERPDAMAFLADQAAGPKGCWIEFFGRPASTYKAIGLLGLEYQAPMACCYSIRREGKPLHFRMTLGEMLDPADMPEHIGGVREITQWYSSTLERAVRQNPEQYWWVHKRWKDYGKKRSLPKKPLPRSVHDPTDRTAGAPAKDKNAAGSNAASGKKVA